VSLRIFFDNFALLAHARNGATKLRELILQLAVQGRLVSQDEADESASLLIERIQIEKTRLEKKKKSISSNTPIVAENEIPYSIPKGWEWTRLANLGFINPRNDFNDADLASFVPMTLVPQKYGEQVKTETRQWAEIKKGFTHFAEGDVVLAKITPCFQNGKAAVMRNLENKIGAGTTELHVFRPIDNLIWPEYVLVYLKSPKFLIDGIPRMTGTAGQKRVPNIYFSHNPFPLPPLEEQKRIVAKVDELMRLCDELEEREHSKRESCVRLNAATLAPLNKAASLTSKEFKQANTRFEDNFDTLYDSVDRVAKLRSTILQLAVLGKLVSQDGHDEPASILLDQIRKRKAAIHKSDRKLLDNGERVLDACPIPLVAGWEWARLDDVLLSLRNGISTPPQDYGRARLLRISALRANAVNIKEFRYLSEPADSYADFRITAGDLLFTRYSGNRAFVGICGVVPPHDEPLIHPDKLIRGRLIPDSLLPQFVSIAMNTGVSRSFVERHLKTTAGQVGIAGRELKRTPIPVPPFDEQNRIVAKVNQLMSLCDQLEAKLRQAEAHGEKLMGAAVRHVLRVVSHHDEAQRAVIQLHRHIDVTGY
jgi:type I restriction enzyme, S subunit